MPQTFHVESHSYDRLLRGSWQAYQLDPTMELSAEQDTQKELIAATASDCIRLWLPAGTPMHWSSGTRSLRSNCLQFFWPKRWYTLSAFYDGCLLRHTYATIIQPAIIGLEQLSFVDLDLSLLVQPNFTYEVLTQAEFEEMTELLHYSEETRISALMALHELTNSVQLGFGLFATIPQVLRQADFHLSTCENK